MITEQAEHVHAINRQRGNNNDEHVNIQGIIQSGTQSKQPSMMSKPPVALNTSF